MSDSNKPESTTTSEHPHKPTPYIRSHRRQQYEYEPCLACKLTGAGTMIGLGSYAFYEQNKLAMEFGPNAKNVWNRRVMLGVVGVACVSAGFYRLLFLP
ncbi:hypothetical protein BKA69DRAFT_1120827 [Paraphysoderma sedebokerense]|nr:hypothetical protein BKA69DRAFT_1120827 [Paraphysoderma sedebokerense]